MSRICLPLLCILSILLTSCASRQSSEQENDPSQNILSFSYRTSSKDISDHWRYLLFQQDDATVLQATGYDKKGQPVVVNASIQEPALQELQKIIKKYDMQKWEGFRQVDTGVQNGASFALAIQYENGDSINARGYVKTPPNYDKAKDAMKEYLAPLIKKYRKTSTATPATEE